MKWWTKGCHTRSWGEMVLKKKEMGENKKKKKVNLDTVAARQAGGWRDVISGS